MKETKQTMHEKLEAYHKANEAMKKAKKIMDGLKPVIKAYAEEKGDAVVINDMCAMLTSSTRSHFDLKAAKLKIKEEVLNPFISEKQIKSLSVKKV